MCGIYAKFNDCQQTPNNTFSKKRGPDATKTSKGLNYNIIFNRLAINDLSDDAMQPFTNDDVMMVCNGEIYNHNSLSAQYHIQNKTNSDCEVILHLYNMFGIKKVVDNITGDFAFIVFDKKNQLVHFARDPFGIKPLYMQLDNGSIELASLIDSMTNPMNDKIEHVVPGKLYTFNMSTKELTFFNYFSFQDIRFNPYITNNHIFEGMKRSVLERITQSNRPVGFFLSGGLDSCTILSIALKYHKFKTPPKVFTFGFSKDAMDMKTASFVVDWFKKTYGDNCIEWHPVVGTLEEGKNTLEDVIRITETYDTTTIRASTPMYLLSKYVAKNTDVKVLISGEGSDELFGGYLYNLYAPNNYELRKEIIKSLENLYLYDCLRADRVTAACGLEIRPPFLDIDLVRTTLRHQNLAVRNKNTKPLLREIVAQECLLPEEIIYGRKEAFSDAVGLEWQDSVEEHANNAVINTSSMFSPYIKADTITSVYFQSVFYKHFGCFSVLKRLWLPNQDWVKTGSEPSARALSIYD